MIELHAVGLAQQTKAERFYSASEPEEHFLACWGTDAEASVH